MKKSTLFRPPLKIEYFKKFLIIFLLFLTFSSNSISAQNLNSNIIPDKQNPIQIINNNIFEELKIVLRFKFSENSSGLIYGNFFGIKFPFQSIVDLNYVENSTPKYTCSLTDGTINYELSPSKKNLEKTTAFCKLSDKVNTLIKNSESTFTLTLNFSANIKLIKNKEKSITLFTTSSTDLNRIIFDQAIFMGNLEIYADYKSQSTYPFEVLSHNLFNGNNGIQKLFPNQIFDLELNISCNSFFSYNDILFTFKYNDQYFLPPNSLISREDVTQTKETPNPLLQALKGNLKVNQNFQIGQISIENIEEDFYPGRKFRILLKNFQVKEKISTNSLPLEMLVYYKNTYSVISYKKINDTFKIDPIKINIFKANHPNNFDIFRSGVFPMKFNFMTNKDILNGGFVQIRHSNAFEGKNRFNFVSSTCDFSENENIIEKNFGKRPVCYPIRTDFNYPDSSNKIFEASGIFFYMDEILSNREYTLTVWGSADACGGSNINDFSFKSAGTNSAKFNFKAKIFSKITPNKINEERFDNSDLLADSIEIQMGNKCYNNQLQLINSWDNSTPADNAYAISPYDKTIFAKMSKTDETKSCADKDNICKLTKDVSLYKEFTNFSLLQSSKTVENLYLNDMTDDKKFIEYFIYGNSVMKGNSYLALKVNIPILEDKSFYEIFPSPVTNYKTDLKFLPGRLSLNLQKNWFKKGEDANKQGGCYLSWGTDAKDDKNANLGPSVLNTIKENTCIVGSKVNENRYMISKIPFSKAKCGSINIEKEIDVENSYLDDDSNNPNETNSLRILSTFNKGNLGYENISKTTKQDIKSYYAFPLPLKQLSAKIKNPTADSNNVSFGLFSNCFTWDTNKPVKSLYTSLDMQVNFLYGENAEILNGPPIRAIRLIKLFPEGGVFQDTSTSGGKFAELSMLPDLSKEGDTQKPYKLHIATGNNYSENGVCLIEIYGTGLVNTIGSSNANVLSIWISFGTLIETDYMDMNSNYPTAPLANDVYNSYGLSSGYFFNAKENFYNLNILKDDGSYYYDKDNTPRKYYKNNLRLLWHLNSLSTPDYNISDTNYGAKTVYNSKNTSSNLSSNYLNFMGSNILITNVLGNKITTINPLTNSPNNLLIPFYCPLNDSVNKTINFMNGFPSLYIAFLDMQSFTDITQINKIFAYKKEEAGDHKFTVVTAVSENERFYRKISTMINSKVFNMADANYKNYLFTLRWAPYNSQILGSEKYLYLFYGTIDNNFTAQNNLNCTGHIFLINSDLVTLDDKVSKSPSIATGFPGVFSNKKIKYPYSNTENSNTNSDKNPKFYFLGNKFNKAVLLGLGDYNVPLSPNSVGGFSFISLSKVQNDRYLKGINRPLIDNLYSNGILKNTFTSVGYFCVSSYREGYQSFSNYLQLKDSNAKKYIFFISDITSPNLMQNEFTVQITKDISEEIFNKDNGANARIVLKTPAKISEGWEINFKFKNNFTASTICGLKNSSKDGNNLIDIATECINDSGNSIKCKAPRSDDNFQICCYNLKLLTDIVKIDELNISVPNNININTDLISKTSYNNLKIYDAKDFLSLPYFSWDTNSSGNPEMGNLDHSQIESIKYLHVSQTSGIGKVEIKINMPRDIVRNSNINILAKSLTGFALPDIKTYCMVTFSYEFDRFYKNSPDVLLDYCDASQISNENKGLVIKTKNIIYKCGLNFSAKKISLILYPIKVIDFDDEEVKKNKFKITITNPNGALVNSKDFDVTKTIASQTLKSKPLVIDQWDRLCKIEKISPNFPGEISDYTFIFDLETYKTTLGKNEANEISLFFPIDLYGNYIDNVICYDASNKIINCGYAEKGILNIRFLQPLEQKKIKVKIYGLINPYYENDINIPCTINNTNFNTDERQNLITGSALIKKGFTINYSETKIGALRFINSVINESPKEPREFLTHIFTITFDTANSYSQLPIELEGNPILIINFPNDYEISYRDTSRINVKINEYKNNGIKIESKNSYTPSVNISGNKIEMILRNLDKITFDNAFRYWEISLFNVPSPKKETNLGKIYSTTGSFKFLLSTEKYKKVYRTYSTFNNFSNILLKNKFDNLLKFNRGLNFKYNEIKWVININNNKNLNIKTGRFFESNFEIYSQGEKTNKPGIASMELNDDLFKTANQKYSINSNLRQKIPFFIGAPCGRASGKYLVEFKFTKESNALFVPIVPLMVNLITNSPGQISFSTKNSIIPGGSTPIYFNFSEPNFDEVIIKATYTNKEYSQNDESAKIVELKIPSFTSEKSLLENKEIYLKKNFYTFFQIENTKATNGQIFSFMDLNTCYKWSDKIISFNISKQPINIPQDLEQSEIFKFSTASADKSLKENSLRIQFIPPVFPIYLNCVLTCFNLNFPSDNDILNGDMKNNYDNYFTKYYFGAFYEKKPYDIIFNNLIRGERYKMKCIISTTESNFINRRSKVFYLERIRRLYPEEYGNYLAVKKPYKTQCLSYEFTNDITEETKRSLVNYCQRIFSNGGYSQNGCVYCIDSEQKILANGMEFAQNEKIGTCEKKKNSLRFLTDLDYNNDYDNKKIENNFNSKAKKFLAGKNSMNLKELELDEILMEKNLNKFRKLQSDNKKIVYFSICQIQNNLCSSDLMNNKTFNYTVDLLNNQTLSEEEISKNLNIQNIKVNRTAKVYNFIKPDLQKSFSAEKNFNTTSIGKYSLSLYNPTPIKCDWSIDKKVNVTNGEKAIDSNKILSCLDKSKCGKNLLVYNIKRNLTNGDKLYALDPLENYDMNFICWNDVPDEKLYSDIYSISLYEAPAKDDKNINNSTDTDGNKGNSTTDGSGESSGAFYFSDFSSSSSFSIFWIFVKYFGIFVVICFN